MVAKELFRSVLILDIFWCLNQENFFQMEVLERMLSGFWPEAPSRCTAISWAELEQVLGMKNKMHQLRKWFYSVRCNKEKSSLIGAISKERKGPWERGRYKMESSGRLMGVTRKDGVGSFPSESFEEEWKWLIFKYLRKGWWFLVSQFFRHKRVGAEGAGKGKYFLWGKAEL